MVFDPRRLRRASFNGIGFHVDTGDVEAGHRVATPTIPNGTWLNESFGPNPRKFEIEAYLAGDAAEAVSETLLAAAETKHRGLLVMPVGGARMVRLTKAKRQFAKDKLGYLSVSIEAVAEPDLSQTRLSPNALAASLFASAGLVTDGLAGFAMAGLQLVGFPVTVLEAAIEAGADILGDLAAITELLRLSPEAKAPVSLALSSATASLAALPNDPAGFGRAVANLAVAIGDAADPAMLAGVLNDLGPPADAAPAQVSRGTSVTIAENAAVAVAITAAARALATGEAQARRTYADRPQAVAARAEAMAVFDDALSRIGRSGLDLLDQLSAMGGIVAELAQRQEADLAPLITVSANRPLPALVWAWSLYGDPGRADELATRAGASHPGFMPERFEALAS
ncbi:hypothetical protein FQV39_28760 [Bosea sp. F3-2]|uniref:DNA circularization N-terminal domain-containing protein n=1 Tax=Bosea sp. F3-2 TaxID=2599640 RepID=UPI0011EDACFE|nr:DNA circularization N-terminal domain-containing protein [Bosea sp. F3-2]QEL26156.1 hypothetical protein FQV39_28760 [Bosea sp. F3-2]